MTAQDAIGVGVLVLVAVMVGAFAVVVAQGGDPTALGAAIAAGTAILTGLVVANVIDRRNGRR